MNTNAGGALLNGLHTAALCDPARLACLCADLLPVEAIQERIARMFAAELGAARGPAPSCAPSRSPTRIRARSSCTRSSSSARAPARCGRRGRDSRHGGARSARVRPGLPARHRFRARRASQRGAARGLPDGRRSADAFAARAPPAGQQAPARSLLVTHGAGALRSGCGGRGLFRRTVPETVAFADLGVARAWDERRYWVFKPCAATAAVGVPRRQGHAPKAGGDRSPSGLRGAAAESSPGRSTSRRSRESAR